MSYGERVEGGQKAGDGTQIEWGLVNHGEDFALTWSEQGTMKGSEQSIISRNQSPLVAMWGTDW